MLLCDDSHGLRQIILGIGPPLVQCGIYLNVSRQDIGGALSVIELIFHGVLGVVEDSTYCGNLLDRR